jgi:hypothetical protein
LHLCKLRRDTAAIAEASVIGAKLGIASPVT